MVGLTPRKDRGGGCSRYFRHSLAQENSRPRAISAVVVARPRAAGSAPAGAVAAQAGGDRARSIAPLAGRQCDFQANISYRLSRNGLVINSRGVCYSTVTAICWVFTPPWSFWEVMLTVFRRMRTRWWSGCGCCSPEKMRLWGGEFARPSRKGTVVRSAVMGFSTEICSQRLCDGLLRSPYSG